MEGVGARLGRSSTRYGPATVFSGPVRKWKKKWVHVSPSNNNSNSNNHHHHHHSNNGSATPNGNNGSHLLLYKWTPISQSNNNNGNASSNSGDKNSAKEEPAAPEEPPRRKFKYIPIALLEEQKIEATENEAAENHEEEAKPGDTDPSMVDSTPRNDGSDEKPDINDVPMEENQEDNKLVRQDLNESTLDLSLGLTAHDNESENLRPDMAHQRE
ncbi:uncharacterized protein DDB_G0285917 [Carica papaya]|uniref:uncharacterized protein DDB_G0285917 n=1 Tax=Carica papaya TaxID=3649 RepID=UPI000B8CC5DD|nr:uncharacterized protein DDB_G0285917 [Carica papaya]